MRGHWFCAKEDVVHTAAFGTNFEPTDEGPASRAKLPGASRIRRRGHDAMSDRPLKLARDLHVGSEFLWTRAHR